MEYHRLDDKHIEVLAGDLKRGFWELQSGKFVRDGEQSVSLGDETRALNIRLTRQITNLDSMSDVPMGKIMGFAISSALGPWGSLANTAVGFALPKNDFLCIGCELKDGREFIAWMRRSVLEQWQKVSSIEAKKREE